MKSEEFSARRQELIDRLETMSMLTSRPRQASDLSRPIRLSDAYKAPEDWPKAIRMLQERKRLD